MLCSPAETRWMPMATRSISITERLIARLPWLGRVFVLFWSGWMPMEISSADSERRICEASLSGLPVCLRVPSP